MVRILDPRIVHSRHHLVRQAAEMPTSDIARQFRKIIYFTRYIQYNIRILIKGYGSRYIIPFGYKGLPYILFGIYDPH